MKDKLEYEVRFGIPVLNGEYYEVKEKGDKKYLVKMDKKVIGGRIQKAKLIAKKLESSLDREKVITEAVMMLTNKDFDKLHNMLFKGNRKYKPKTREHRCVDMKVGNFVLPIVGNSYE